MNRKQNYLGGNSEYCNKRKYSINYLYYKL